ncbi:MAG: DNA mismatch repair endonuclease MutL [Bacteroidales bacterium]|nr:DNA mismatch repair endonuclease MutL [Bacteroidales bacterium]
MADIIHLLPDSVANQIAAGEVIQRPASVVKELVENALDAGATNIQVIVTDAGKTCVQVVDNGKGMSDTDARLAFERHATSKISQADDLFSLTTMGFRGEALASIAAVAQVELRTRHEGEELGVSIRIEGSRIVQQEVIACPVGANFIVKNLFFNVPARRKFLKTNLTEYRNIQEEVQRIALAHPDISFQLSTPDSAMLTLQEGSFRQRIVSIFGKRMDKQLLPVAVETTAVVVNGFVGGIESRKKKGAEQFFFVNGRYMRHPYFAKAVQSAFERYIPEGDQVPFFLHLVVDPAKIDVNIHPTKTEIKFEEEQIIWQILNAAVREAISKDVPTIEFDTECMPEIPIYDPQVHPSAMPSITVDAGYNPFAPTSSSSRGVSSAKVPNWESYFENDKLIESSDLEMESFPSFETEQTQLEPTLYKELATTDQHEWEFGASQLLQYRGRYLMAPTEQGLLLIDQHRAHIRILFERYIEQMRDKMPESQGILFPEIIELSPSQTSLLQAIEGELSTIGFEVSFLGNGSFSILSIPAGIDGLSPSTLLQSILDDAIHKSVEMSDEIKQTIALSLARRAALPVGQVLNLDEMRRLAADLFATSSPNFTPDGRPIVTLLPHALLVKNFN